MFVDRNQELAFLNQLLTRKHPGPAQLALLFGRRRVGKSELLLQWATKSGVDFVYWEAVRENATQQRTHLLGKLLNVPASAAPVYRSWSELWGAAAPLLLEKRRLLILDELPYAADADPAMLSALQYAWDQHFQNSETIIILCGSHVRVMETLFSSQSPLFGRMTAQWHLEPLPFSSLVEFFPRWDADARVAAYAIVGGIPAYLKWLDPDLDLVDNIRQVILNPGSMFLAEPAFLLYDQVREPHSYLAILKAIGAGAHTVTEIGDRAFLPTTSVSFYLNGLREMRLVERRLPVTQRRERRTRSRSGRYYLTDPYFRFYFRFLEPFVAAAPFDPERVLESVRQGLRTFVGGTAFEELARQWVWQRGRSGQLPFIPDSVGAHWSSRVQVDVVAINWQERNILLGECKWGTDRVNHSVARELVEDKARRILRDLPDEGAGWKMHFALFARSSFTPAAVEIMREHNGFLVNLAKIDRDLGRESR